MLRFMTRKSPKNDPTQADTTGIRDLDAGTTYSYTMNRMGQMGLAHQQSLALGQFIQFHYTADAEL